MQEGGALMGKYTKLRGVVPAFVEESSYQEKVNAEKQEILGVTEGGEGANVNRLAAFFASNKAAKDALEEQVSVINVRLEALSQLLCESLEEQSMEKVTLSSGATGYIQDTPYPSVKDRVALYEWGEKEFGKKAWREMLTMNYNTLKAITSERLVGGKPAPAGVEVFLKTQFRLRGGNGDE